MSYGKEDFEEYNSADNTIKSLRAEVARLRAENERLLVPGGMRAEIERACAERDQAWERIKSLRAEVERMTDENRKMNATLASDATQIYQLEAEVERLRTSSGYDVAEACFKAEVERLRRELQRIK